MMIIFIAVLFVLVTGLSIVNMYILHELDVVKDSLDKLDNKELLLRATIMNHIKQIAKLKISIANLQGNYSDSAEKSQS